MKNFLVITLAVFTVPIFIFGHCRAQTAPNLGTAAGFALYTSVGEFANTGTTTVTGDIGNGAGAVTGNAVSVTGNTHFGDSQGIAAAADVAAAYAQLTNEVLNPCGFTLTSLIGQGAVLTPGVYCSTTATVLTGDLTLNAAGNPDATFIFKIDGALSVDTPVNILLTGGASLKNVYWQVNGAFNLAAGAVFKGTVINAGAINLASGASISGRALSTAGKISLSSNNVSNAQAALPVSLVNFVVKKGESQTAVLDWSTTSEMNSDRFEVERSANSKSWKIITTLVSRGESNALVSYSFTDSQPNEGSNYYRLKMIDKDETFAYSRIRQLEFGSQVKTYLYPNPTSTQLTLSAGDLSKIERIEFNDISGKLLLCQNRFPKSNMNSVFNVNNFPAGLYIVKVTHTDGYVDTVKIVKR